MISLSLESATETIDLDALLDTEEGMQAIAGLTGFGLPSVEVQWLEGAGDGATFRRRRVLPRDIDLPLYIAGEDREGLKLQVAALSRVLAGEAILRIHEDGDSMYAVVHRVGGGTYTYGEDTNGELDLKMTVTLRAGVPYWIHTNAITVTQGYTAFGSMSIENPGTADAYPVWTFTGPLQDISITSPEGSVLEWNGLLLGGESLTIDSGAGTVVDGTGASRYAELASAPRFWAVKPGVSVATTAATVVDTMLARTNHVPNPTFNTDTTGWALVPATGTSLTWSGTGLLLGTRLILNADAGKVAQATTTVTGLTPGKLYQIAAAGTHNNVGGDGSSDLRIDGIPVLEWTNTVTGYSSRSTTFTAPLSGEITVSLLHTAGSANNSFAMGSWHVSEPTSGYGYFDGSTADTATNIYEWLGTAHASKSTLTVDEDQTLASISCALNARDWMVV